MGTWSIGGHGRVRVARLLVVAVTGVAAGALAVSARAAPVVYRYQLTVAGSGTANLSSNPASNTYTSESGQASAQFTVAYDIEFSVDSAAQTVSVESLNPADQAGTITASSLSGVDSYSETTTCVPNSTCKTSPVTCQFSDVPIGTDDQSGAIPYLEPLPGVGPSHDAYVDGTVALLELGGATSQPPNASFPCSNPAAGAIRVSAGTIPGLTSPTCGSTGPGYTLDVPVDDLGQKHFVLDESGSGSGGSCAIGSNEQASYTITLALAPQAEITGIVRNRAGKALPGLAMEAVGDGPGSRPSYQTVTASNGGYHFNLDPGKYRVFPANPATRGASWLSPQGSCNPHGLMIGDACFITLTTAVTARYDLVYFTPDLVAEALEPTQAIQDVAWYTPSSVPVPGFPRPVPGGTYTGVPLVEGVVTVVRLYGYAAAGRGASLVFNVPAQLRGYREVGGQLVELPGSPLDPISYGLDTAALPLYVGPILPGDRTSPDRAYTFRLPESWMHVGSLTLVGEVDPPVNGQRPIDDCCEEHTEFALSDIPVRAIKKIVVTPVEIVYRFPGQSAPIVGPNLAAEWQRVREVLPLPDNAFELKPYPAAVVNITAQVKALTTTYHLHDSNLADCITNTECRAAFHRRVLAALKAVNLERGPRNFIIGYMGVNDGVSNLAPGTVAAIGASNPPNPLSGLAHEFMHLLGFNHASAACGAALQSNGPYVDWPPDQKGYIEGIGLDRTLGSGAPGGPYRIMENSARTPWYDIMSYCNNATDSDTWISTRNWTLFVNELG